MYAATTMASAGVAGIAMTPGFGDVWMWRGGPRR
jgi:hypothetical protein